MLMYHVRFRYKSGSSIVYSYTLLEYDKGVTWSLEFQGNGLRISETRRKGCWNAPSAVRTGGLLTHYACPPFLICRANACLKALTDLSV